MMRQPAGHVKDQEAQSLSARRHELNGQGQPLRRHEHVVKDHG
jgi:hypothetical protein